MSSPIFVRDNYSDFYGEEMLPALEELFRWNLNRHPSLRDVLFKTVAHDRDIYQATSLHDMPLPQEIEEGQDYSFSSPAQGASKTLKPVKFGLGFSISEEAVEDGKFQFISDAVAKMAKSCREGQDVQAMNIFNNSFTTETVDDGSAICATSHALPSGGTWRNRLSSDADLSDTSLQQMLVDFETQFVGDSGIKYLIRPKYLVVAPGNKRLARELIESELAARTATVGTDGITNVNNKNTLIDEGLVVIHSPHLTDPDAWWLVGEKEDHGLRIISRKPVETKAAGPDAGFANDSILYKCRYREKIGAIAGRGIFGTTGAG